MLWIYASNWGDMVLIVALRENLEEVYTSGDIGDLENKLEEYRAALEVDDLDSEFYYLDDDEMTSIVPGGKKVTDPDDWTDIATITTALIEKLDADYLFVLGGYTQFPQPEFSCGSCPDAYYSKYQSDYPYVDVDNDNLPDIPIGRLPEPNNGDMDVLLTYLDTAIDLHKSGGLDLSDYISIAMPKMYYQGRCYCTLTPICFNKAALGVGTSDSRYLSDGVPYTTLGGHEFAFINVHGSDGTPQMFVSDSCQNNFVMYSTSLDNLNLDDAVWLLGTCYSSYLKNKNKASDSMPMQFFLNGGAVYFGGTLTQYASSDELNRCDDCGCATPDCEVCDTETHTCSVPEANISDAEVEEAIQAFYADAEYPIAEITLQGASCTYSQLSKSAVVSFEGIDFVAMVRVLESGEVVELGMT